MKITKKQGTFLLVGAFVVITSIYAYQSAQLTNNVQQVPEKSHLDNTVIIKGEKSANSPQPDSTDILVSKPAKVGVNKQGGSTITGTSTKVSQTEIAAHKNQSQHNKPADHDGNRQAKHHGHEHEKVRRHPEDNSIIPPGEPKKPVPKQEGEGNQ